MTTAQSTETDPATVAAAGSLFAVTVTVEEAAALLGLSYEATRARVHRGSIPSVHIGRAVLVPVAALDGIKTSRGGRPVPTHAPSGTAEMRPARTERTR